MNQDATSLDRLHDLVVPPEVSWWPLAPAWYVLLALLAGLVAWGVLRRWMHWRSNAYRRVALAELESAASVATVSEILRRAALHGQPRDVVASLAGDAWPRWLAQAAPAEMPVGVQRQLAEGVYAARTGGEDLSPLRAYAREWIYHHRFTRS